MTSEDTVKTSNIASLQEISVIYCNWKVGPCIYVCTGTIWKSEWLFMFKTYDTYWNKNILGHF